MKRSLRKLANVSTLAWENAAAHQLTNCGKVQTVFGQLSPPQFRQDCGQFVQTLWRPPGEVTPDVAGQAKAQATVPDKALSANMLQQLVLAV